VVVTHGANILPLTGVTRRRRSEKRADQRRFRVGVGVGALGVGHVGIRPCLVHQGLDRLGSRFVEAEIGDQGRWHLVAGKPDDAALSPDVARELLGHVIEGELLRIDGKAGNVAPEFPLRKTTIHGVVRDLLARRHGAGAEAKNLDFLPRRGEVERIDKPTSTGLFAHRPPSANTLKPPPPSGWSSAARER
jgi:hypothetical protein